MLLCSASIHAWLMLHGCLLLLRLSLLGGLLLSSLPALAKRRIIMDSTQDNPSITALLMALELSSSPDSNVEFLGAITTESDGLQQLRQLLDMANLSQCMPPILSVDEIELYPVDGQEFDEWPSTVKFLLDMAEKYPGDITLYSSGSLAAYSMASQVDPTFDSKIAEVRSGLHPPS